MWRMRAAPIRSCTGKPDHQIDAQRFRLVGEIDEIGVADDERRMLGAELLAQARGQSFAVGAGSGDGDIQADLATEGRERHHQIVFTVDQHPLAAAVFVAVDIAVEQAAAFGGESGRHFAAAQRGEGTQQLVGGAHADRDR